jgi:hypothetical protein
MICYQTKPFQQIKLFDWKKFTYPQFSIAPTRKMIDERRESIDYLPEPKSAIATISTLLNGYLIPKYSA